jgi:uncharacterized protein YeaO (DUF488 family)
LRVPEDRREPLGITQARVRVELRLKTIAPRDASRRRAHADRAVDSSIIDYMRELEGEPARRAAAGLRERDGSVTLLYATRDEARNNALVRKSHLEKAR